MNAQLLAVIAENDDGETFFKEVPPSEFRHYIRDGVDGCTAGCTLFKFIEDRYTDDERAVVLVAKKDYPAEGCMLVQSIYAKESYEDDSWTKVDYYALRDFNDCSLMAKTAYLALKHADNVQHLFIPTSFSSESFHREWFEDVDTADNSAACTKIFQLAQDQLMICSSFTMGLDNASSHVDVLGIRADDMVDELNMEWMQFKKSNEVKQRLMDFIAAQKRRAASKFSQHAKSHGGYFSEWQKQSGNSIDSICSQLAEKMDRKVTEVYGSYESFAKQMAEAMPDGHMSDTMQKTGISRLVDRRSWWDLISDQTYKAIVSRNAAVHQGKLSRGVSLRVLRECLDKMCYDLSVLYIQSRSHLFKKLLKQSQAACTLRKVFEQNGMESYVRDAQWLLLDACGSYIDDANRDDDDTGHGMISSTTAPSTFQTLFKELNSIKYTEDNDNAIIACISKTVDHVHNRGSLAGVFIEGGSRTCNYVSNMAPDEVHESRKCILKTYVSQNYLNKKADNMKKHNYTRKHICEAIAYWKKQLDIVNESSYDKAELYRALDDESRKHNYDEEYKAEAAEQAPDSKSRFNPKAKYLVLIYVAGNYEGYMIDSAYDSFDAAARRFKYIEQNKAYMHIGDIWNIVLTTSSYAAKKLLDADSIDNPILWVYAERHDNSINDMF